jgi:hypothetical protein
MAKNNTKHLESKSNVTEKNIIKNIIPERFQDALLVILLGLLLLIFFREPLFGDGSFWGASDNISGQSFKNYLEQSDQFPLWQPYIFGGLPGFAAVMESAVRTWDLTYLVFHYTSIILKSIFDSDAAKALFWYFIMMWGMYFLMRQHKFEKLISFFSSFAFIFCTGILIWMMIGHNAKEMTFAVVPWIFFMIEKIKERVSLLNIVILTILMHVMLAGGHVQMIFYTACVVGIYLICDLISQLVRKNNWLAVCKLIGVFVIATGLAVLMSADRYFSTLEYVPHSTRGSAPITARINGKFIDNAASKLTKEDYEYATMWSNSPEELIDMFVPSYHGFGKVKYSGILTNNQETKIMTYWGQKPFEDATPYMGAVVLFLSLIGIFRFFKENIFVKALTVTIIFAIFLSFGSTLPILYDLFFYNFPKFSSFRAPIMIYVLLHFAVPILAGFGLKALCNMREQFGIFKSLPKIEKTPLMIFFACIGIFIIAGIIFANGFETSYISDVSNSPVLKGYGEQTLSYLAPFIFETAVSDWTIIGILCLITAILSFFFVNKKLSPNVFIVAIIIITMIDLWRVSSRAIDLVPKSVEKQPFQQTDVINFIKRDMEQSGERFRICDLSSQVANSDAYFFIENINGYHPAKLRTFQDMMDIMCGGSTSNVTHPFMWNLMNAKYIITQQQLSGGSQPIFQSQQTGAFVYYNPSYCKRAFFVDSVIVEKDDYKILMHLDSGDFNPKVVAYIEKLLSENIVPSGQYLSEMKDLERQMQQIDSTFKLADNDINPAFVPMAKIVEYKNEYIKIETETQGQHLLVLSEMYYPIDWKAYIDGKETEIYKTNFAFRSVVVPAGKHIVEFRFVSDIFILGRNLSAGTNIVTIIALILGILLELKRKKKVVFK